MQISTEDKQVLRELGRQYMAVATLPVHKQKAELWRRLNRLEPVRPLVWINELPWHELNVDDELTLRCTDSFCRWIEASLRTTLYQWRHMPGDMVVDPVLLSQYVCSPQSCYADWGIQENAMRAADGFGSAKFVPVIRDERDVDKLRTPEVTVDWCATERNFQATCEIFDGIAPVRKTGIVHQWMAPWDVMIHWYGIEQLYMDMVDRPELVHKLLKRFMAGVHDVLNRQEAMGLLAVSNGNHRVGSGGLGITDTLPQPDFDGKHVRPKDQWGTSTGQIFSEVSPDMHEEFCLQYERPYLARFGLNCYGCCEPLHKKIHLMRTIPNLRRISMSTWVKVEEAAAKIGGDFIFSYKPNPAVLAAEEWNPELARANLTSVMEKTRGCRVEFIMKDVSTVRNQPQRIWAWEKIAMQVAQG
ncbi:MAG TPA: hypothetical protein VM141_03230 [Planctomycetota bacterium]|nr:hypothetical protein [Planctomycetota bacterium]